MPRILIIEDEPSIAMVIREFLKDEGFETKEAYDGASGLKILDDGYMPDLVMADLNMPVLSGREVVGYMRSRNKFMDIPVIIITGSIPNSTEFPEQGSYQDVLQKPFEFSNMLNKINNILNYRQDISGCGL
jgi:CheY-like chemotaxis protein